jgi:YHS domain-containing protein/thiol-disulfide isomerase/thioredoxin
MVMDMRSLLRWTATVALLASSAAAQAQTQIPWAANLEQAQQAATEQRKLVLLHFHNDHCPPCERVEREVYSQPQVAEAIARNYIPVKIHAGEKPKIAEQFRVDRWPTDIISLPSGQEIMRTTSPQKPADYIGMVDQIAMRTGVGAARHWQSSMAAAGQTVLDPQVAQAQAVAGQAADAAQGYANQAATTAQGFANQSTSTFQNYAQQANRWNQQANGAAQQLGNTAQQLGNSAQQMGSLVQNTGRDVRNAWEAGAAASTAPQGPPADSPYAQFAQPQPGLPPAVQPQTAQAPAAQPQLPPEPSLPTANPFIGAALPQRVATPQLPHALTTQQPVPQTAAPQDAAAPSAAPAAQPMGSLAGSPSPALTADQGLVPASQAPAVAMEGYCPVTLLEQRKWKRSDPKYGAIHRGRTYLFSSEAEQQKFLANPDGYSPMLSGFDPVIFSQRGELVEGKRSYGLTYNKQIFLFADEGSLQAFSKSPHAFAQQAHQAMNQAETGSKLR